MSYPKKTRLSHSSLFGKNDKVDLMHMDCERLTNATLIASGKGGVGKTWFSINLAHALGGQSKRVLLFDGDLGLSNVDIQLGLKPEWDIGSVLKRKCSFEDAILNYKPTEDFHNHLDIIAGKAVEGAFTSVSKAGILKLKDSLTVISPKYDHMIMDLSAGLDQIIQEFSTFAQQCLVIVTDEPMSMSDAFAFIKVSNQRNPDLPIHIVVNKADSDAHGKQTYTTLLQACKHFLKTTPSLVGIIHRDPCVPDSILQKALTSTTHPNSRVAQDIKKIALELVRINQNKVKN
ncbi:MAG: MinD/ParA family protein [Alphaproteobacteria bacterium]|nr:MinD/ParA family protein [Alphaproteobacteria bacterium]